MKVYAFLDRKVREFGQLLVAANDEAMKRLAYDTLNGGQSMLAKYPDDFDLFCVGEYNHENGALNGHPPQLVCNLASVIRKPDAQQLAIEVQ